MNEFTSDQSRQDNQRSLPGDNANTYSPAAPSAQPPPPPRGPRWGLIIGIIVAVVAFFGGLLILGFIGLISSFSQPTDLGLGPKVGVIEVSGPISAGGGGSWLFGGPRGSRAVMAQLRQAATDKAVKAVVVRINSPGGTVAASQAIYKEVTRLAEQKPVVASMADVAASGGYYVASAADIIVANPGTITGSIGVIMETLTFYELMEKVGLDDVTITSGQYKDTGSPFRPMRADERQLLEDMLQDVYEQFVTDVATAREMDINAVKKLADGRIYTGAQAKEVGLVDQLGNFHDAVQLAAEKGGIEGKPALKEYGRVSPWGSLFSGAVTAIADEIRQSYRQQAGELLLSPTPHPQLR